MKIALASDHAGWKTKEEVKKYLGELKHSVKDFGTDSEDSVDYPDFAIKAAKAVKAGKAKYGILICGSGIGMCIAANKIKGIRAANAYSKLTAELSRRHNNANVLCLGARILDMKIIKDIIKVWLETPFEGGRHQRRVDKLNNLSITKHAKGRSAYGGKG
jgi:ribose 5-phosphate isomerase B